jgi:hypothetical protein
MDPTRELVDATQVGTALAVLSVVALVLAGGLYARGRRPGAFLAGCAVLLFPLWLVYNGIENALGLDSVAALLINGVLFAALGTGVGLLYRRLSPEAAHHGDTETRRGNESNSDRITG